MIDEGGGGGGGHFILCLDKWCVSFDRSTGKVPYKYYLRIA